ncbi:hypothetical protein [Brevundimonas sp.]|uniref:hypothetical protein n=1 Tax=Brevundimonas sp. TaxID=1871086 RepID=UPI00273070FB|nr:hypothetical protein [Brevundimonas sp.]MDP1912579.1 hypothetical protein [Brevundimonas sp.]
MAGFSIGTAIAEAFGLIGRRPLAVFAWGLLMVAPIFGALGLMFPAMGEIFANMPDPDAGTAGDSAFSEGMVAQMMQFQMASLLANLGQYVGLAIVYTAIFRAVLRPTERSFFSLRVGMDELRVAVAGLAIGIGVYIVMIFAVLLCVALGFGLWAQGEAVALWTCGIVGLAMFVALLWGLARVSLIAPASVLYRDFAFAEGWKLAAGKGWPLLGMLLLLYLMVVVIYVVVIIIVAVAAGGGIAATGSAWEGAGHDGNPFGGMSAWMAVNWPWLVVGGLVLSWVYGAFMTLMVAPFASACRQLAESSEPLPAVDNASPEPAV